MSLACPIHLLTLLEVLCPRPLPWMALNWGNIPLFVGLLLGSGTCVPLLLNIPFYGMPLFYFNHVSSWKPDSLKDISRKLATIWTCLSVQRVHTITHIDFNVQFQSSGTYLFVFHDLKVARQRPYFIISLPAVSVADPLGTVELLQKYLSLTKPLRGSTRQLFISYVVPHQPVSSDTVARWVKSVMTDAGIDKCFGAHSVRGASSSLAKALAVPLDAVLKAGDWSALRSFNRHYHRQESQLPPCAVANALMSAVSK